MWFIKSNISCPILPFLNKFHSMHVIIYFLWRFTKLIINKPQRQETIIMAVQYTTIFSNPILFGIILSLIFDKMFEDVLKIFRLKDVLLEGLIRSESKDLWACSHDNVS
jgi:hypothetical protein